MASVAEVYSQIIMAKFLSDNALNSELEKIFDQAHSKIVIVSPYIRLHDRFGSTILTKVNNPRLQVIIVFGKNEDDLTKSFRYEDFLFFQQFPNIQIRYERRLHAKYYANETSAIITSMNLYEFSNNSNIEIGIKSRIKIGRSKLAGLLSKLFDLGDEFDFNAWQYLKKVIDQSDLLFEKVPQYENSAGRLKRKYLKSTIKIDSLTAIFNDKNQSEDQFYKPFVNDYNPPFGFCIRCKLSIIYDPYRPYCKDCYSVWSSYENRSYIEKCCHRCGNEAETTMAKPQDKACWQEWQDTMPRTM